MHHGRYYLILIKMIRHYGRQSKSLQQFYGLIVQLAISTTIHSDECRCSHTDRNRFTVKKLTISADRFESVTNGVA
ncbi:hypothetical protein D3C81_2014620 [compost metagenome]